MSISLHGRCRIFFDLDPAKPFPLHRAANAVSKSLGKLIEANVKAGPIAGVVEQVRENRRYLKDYSIHMIRRLLEAGLPEINRLMDYAMEGIRLNGTFGSYRECTTTDTW